MDQMWHIKTLVIILAVSALASQARALPLPTTLLQGRGINPWRDLDGQAPTSPDDSYVTEDRVRSRDGRVGPGVGGQRYDWEGLYFWRTETTAYVVLATGFRILPGRITRDFPAPSSPDSRIAGVDFTDRGSPVSFAGDLLFDTGRDGTWDYGITLGAYPNANGRAGMTYGGLYLVDQTGGYRGTGAYRPGHRESGPWIGVAEIILTGLDYSAEMIRVTQQGGEDMNGTDRERPRYLAAFAVDLSLFPDFTDALAVHWTMECGNDEGNLESPEGPPPTPPVPEPFTVLLLGAGGAILHRWQRRRS